MGYTLNQLGGTLIKQLSDIVNGGDERVPASPDSFISWCAPGIPFDPSEFEFAAEGFGTAADAQAYNRRLDQAYAFSQLVDFVPSFAAPYGSGQQEYLSRPSEQRLSHMYREILRFSKVAEAELTDEQTAKLEKFRGLLRTTKKVKDIVTDEETEVTEESPMMKAYNERMVAYITAALQYNAKRIAAESAVGPEGVKAASDWANNAELYYLQVRQAQGAWDSGGYRNDVDKINAYVNQTTTRSMVLWKQGLLEDVEKAIRTAPGGGKFHYTTLIPGRFATNAGWTQYTLSHHHSEAHTREEAEAWGVKAGCNFGLFSFGGGVEHSSSSYDGNRSVDEFGLSFELAPVVVCRPWFYPEFFANRGWSLDPGAGWNYDQMPSDGDRPPKGNFCAYSTMALFARNIEIRSKQFVEAYHEAKSSTAANANVGYGPFSLSAHYERSDRQTDWSATTDESTLRVPGMQIIGFINHMVGKAPNLLDGIDPATLV